MRLAQVRSIPHGFLLLAALSAAVEAQSTKELKSMLGDLGYSVSATAAFELLPDKPDEATHLVTGKDFSAAAGILGGGRFLKNSTAFDMRPGIFVNADLTEYQRSWWKRVLWRSTLSLGTTEAAKDHNDAFAAVGLRLSLADEADPRANEAYSRRLLGAIARAVAGSKAPEELPTGNDKPATAASLQQAMAAAMKEAEQLRDSLARATWNAFKLDLGLGWVNRVRSAALSPDSVVSDRAGLWLAGAYPIFRDVQLNAVAKGSWVRPDTAGAETHRWVLGVRMRWFAAEWMTLSAEAAHTRSVHHGANAFDDGWNHFALFAEVNVEKLGGWVGVGYGGDTKRKDGVNNGLQLRYSVYKEAILEK